MSVGTYQVKILCLNCTDRKAAEGIVSGTMEYPAMSSIGPNYPVDVIPPGLTKLRGVKKDSRLEYRFTCLNCGREVWLQVREEIKSDTP